MTWFTAKNHCETKGGKLVEIDSKDENMALVGEINRGGYNVIYNNTYINRRGYVERKMNFWIGLSDVKSEGNWRLASNNLNPSYLNWHKGEPSNETDQDCARLRIVPYLPFKNTWSDINCKAKAQGHFSLHALCEYDSLTNRRPIEDTTKGASTKSYYAH